MRPLRIQLWSYNYEPEPTGIGPIASVWAREMQARGHAVDVVTAHPHYPEPRWGRAVLPYREYRGGIPTLRLPLSIGRHSTAARIRQELSYVAWLSVASPVIRSPDVIVGVSPSFPALLPAMVNAHLRRTPWMLWLQDILPDGAQVTGLLREGPLLAAARRFEKAAYASASRIFVLSESFAENLRSKGVPKHKVVKVYNPATRPVREVPRDESFVEGNRVMTMGNIGHSQGLGEIVSAFQENKYLEGVPARFRLVGDGVAAADVRARITTERVEITGIVAEERLDTELSRAALAVVSQRYEGVEFNVPSKLMNFMGAGLPVIGSVREESEVARILRASGAGWVVDSLRPDQCAALIADVLSRPDELRKKGAAGLAFAHRHFSVGAVADAFEAAMVPALGAARLPS